MLSSESERAACASAASEVDRIQTVAAPTGRPPPSPAGQGCRPCRIATEPRLGEQDAQTGRCRDERDHGDQLVVGDTPARPKPLHCELRQHRDFVGLRRCWRCPPAPAAGQAHDHVRSTGALVRCIRNNSMNRPNSAPARPAPGRIASMTLRFQFCRAARTCTPRTSRWHVEKLKMPVVV